MPKSLAPIPILTSIAAALFAQAVVAQPRTFALGQADLKGGALLRDGRPWVPHGFYQIAFEVAPANLARADHPFWTTAQKNYTPEEFAQMRRAGADTVRIQLSQAAADPNSPIFDSGFVQQALSAVRAAREAGLTVIISIQGESHVPGGYGGSSRPAPAATEAFLHYLRDRRIGVVAGIWDWAPGGFGSVRWGFPEGRFSQFEGLTCHQPGYGIGRAVERLFSEDAVAPSAP